jgi:transcriptional regulator with XRE-family HTH domain
MNKNRIKELREELGISQVDLAIKINEEYCKDHPDFKKPFTNQKNISSYETCERMPTLDVIEYMANIFNCSIDYIVMRTDLRNNKVEIDKRLINLLNDFDRDQVCPEKLEHCINFIKQIDLLNLKHSKK